MEQRAEPRERGTVLGGVEMEAGAGWEGRRWRQGKGKEAWTEIRCLALSKARSALRHQIGR
jgi:hypothetical protein